MPTTKDRLLKLEEILGSVGDTRADSLIPADVACAAAFAQVSIALSLRRIAEALENQPSPPSPKWWDDNLPNWGGLTDSPIKEELRRAGMIASPAEQALDESVAGVRKWAEGPDFHAPPVSPTGDIRAAVRGAALEIESNIVYLEDMAAQESIVDNVIAIIAKHLFPSKDKTPLTVTPEQLAKVAAGETVEIAPAPGEGKRLVVSVEDADPFAGVCNRCGWQFQHVAHDEQYGSHKFEPGEFKSLGEWRAGQDNA